MSNMDGAAYVASSEHRAVVLSRLLDSPGTPSSIADDVGIRIEHVSRSLKELRERDMAELLVDEDTHKGRIHGPTEDGRDAYELAAEIGEVPV